MARSTLWLLLEQLALKVPALLAVLIVAPALGPAQYGVYAYAMALLALCVALSHLGLEGLAVRELRTASAPGPVFGTILVLKGVGGLGAALVLGLLSLGATGPVAPLLPVLALAALAIPLSEAATSWFRARARPRAPALAQGLGQGLGLVLKVGAVLSGLGLGALAWAHAAGWIFVVFLLILALWRGASLGALRFEGARARALLREGAWIYLGSLLALIYLRVDVAMLSWLSTAEETGRYSFAASLSEAAYFLPVVLLALRFPALVDSAGQGEAHYGPVRRAVFFELSSLAWLCLLLVLPLGVGFIDIWLDDAYAGTGALFAAHLLALPFIFLRQGFSRHLVLAQLARFSLLTQGVGAVVNVGLNALLIPTWGAGGAVAATIVAYASAGLLAPLAFSATRPVAQEMLVALLTPQRGIAFWMAQRRSKNTPRKET